MLTASTDETAGLDERGLQIIDQRLSIMLSHLSGWLEADGQSTELLLRSDSREALQDWFGRFESLIQRIGSDDLSAIRNGLRDWKENYLFPLACELDLHDLATKAVLRQCWEYGDFDSQHIRGSPRLRSAQTVQLSRPKADEVMPRIQRILGNNTTQEAHVNELTRSGICRDRETAQRVLKRLERNDVDSTVNQTAMGLTRGLILSLLRHGQIGLLFISDHPCADILLNLERRRQSIAKLSQQPDIVLAMLRADLLALQEVLSNIPRPQANAQRRGKPKKKLADQRQTLWHQDLLYQPPHALARSEYRALLVPEQSTLIIRALAHRRGCNYDEAQKLLDTLLDDGLDELINWRCHAAECLSQETFRFLRLSESIERHLAGFQPDIRQDITRLLRELVVLIDELRIPLDLASLLDSQPSGRKRATFASRVPYNPIVGSRRPPEKPRSNLKPKRRWGYHRPPRNSKAYEMCALFATYIDQLAKAFGVRVGLEESQARARLRSLGDYGGIGLLPKKDWPATLDSRLVSYLYFLKFGSISGTLRDTVLLDLANEYADELEVPRISMQIARAVLSTQVKVRRWNGGVGDSIIGVRQRPSLKLSSTGQLNLVWRLFPIHLRLPIAESDHSVASEDCYAIIVLDLSSQRPVGCWVTIATPQSEQVGLALFHAIWHPGIPDWPVRGFPAIIQIPRSLVSSGSVTAVERVAHNLHAKIQIVADDSKRALLRKLTYAENLLEREIEFDGCVFIREKAEGRALPIKYIQDRLVEWLRFGRRTEASPGCFPNHRSPDVPAAFRKNGYTLPAQDSPAAGWLLTIVDTIKTVRDGVRFDDRLYSSPWFRTEPGVQVKIRAFPYRYSPMPQSIFVEQDGGRLVYLAVDNKEV